jgi:hypothetical protein|tara:strand:+ start:482 stop:628 length:147 start_codon:yes stop_codon:yes gene_type:complete
MIELLTWAGIGFILTLAIIGALSNVLFPLFLELNDEINEKFKDETPSK